MTHSVFDYIIVGAGSAGCVLANRLSADPSVTVALLEAGGEHDHFLINTPLGFGKLMRSERFAWSISTEPEPDSNDRRFFLPHGRVLGGSSSINGLLYVRGQAQDYDDWAAAGATGWDWDSVRDFFLRSEDHFQGASAYHSVGGELRIEAARDCYPIESLMEKAGVAAGLEVNSDFNGRQQAGIGRYQFTMKNGRRWSAANAYLDPVRQRDNLAIITDAMVQRVDFSDGKASGVTCMRAQEALSIEARREVILSAGTLQSPQLLQLSGIGAGALLNKFDIGVRFDSPNVGENFHDHVGVPMAWRLNHPKLSLNRRLRLPRLLGELCKYLINHRGVLAMPAASIGIFASSDGGARPDLQFHCLPVTGDIEAEAKSGEMSLDAFPGLTLMPNPARPRSRGLVKIRSRNIEDAPVVRGNWFSDPYDMSVLLKGMHLAQRLASTEPLAAAISHRVYPGPDDDSDVAFAEFVRNYSHVAYHPVGTCRLGSDPASVVDCELRVRGVDALRVVDGSVIPTITSGNTHAPIVMIAEKAAQMIAKSNR